MGLAGIRLWDDRECARVHDATLRVLADCGVEVRYGPALERFAELGARVDGTRVRLDAALVENALASAPRSWTVQSSGGDSELCLEDGRVYFGTGSDCLYITDVDSGADGGASSRTYSASRPFESHCHIDFEMSMISPETYAGGPSRCCSSGDAEGHAKPLMIVPRDGYQLALMKEMAAVCGGADSLMVYGMPSPPLMHDEFALTKVMECARLGIALVYAPAPTAGTTAPASVAAVAVVANAEVLSGLVLHQAVAAGAPFVYGTGCDVIDMRTMIDPYVTPEWCQGGQAGCDLAHFYGLPSFSYAAFSDAKTLDEQWAAESGLTAVIGALSRATLLHDVGYLESGLQTSFQSVVLGDELVGFAKALLREVAVDDEALAVDEILAVGPGGNHLARPYTRTHYRRFWTTTLLDHAAHDRWAAGGGVTLRERIDMRIRDVLSRERSFVLPDDAAVALDRLTKDGMEAGTS